MGVDRGAIADEGLQIVATHVLGVRDLFDSQKPRLTYDLKVVGLHDLKFNPSAAHRTRGRYSLRRLIQLMLIYAKSLGTPRFQPYKNPVKAPLNSSHGILFTTRSRAFVRYISTIHSRQNLSCVYPLYLTKSSQVGM